MNKSKSKVIIFGPKKDQTRVSTQFKLFQLEITDWVGNLSAVMDSGLNFQKHKHNYKVSLLLEERFQEEMTTVPAGS